MAYETLLYEVNAPLALIILKTEWGREGLDRLSQTVTTILLFGEKGAEMVFGPLVGFVHQPLVDKLDPPEASTWF